MSPQHLYAASGEEEEREQGLRVAPAEDDREALFSPWDSILRSQGWVVAGRVAEGPEPRFPTSQCW